MDQSKLFALVFIIILLAVTVYFNIYFLKKKKRFISENCISENCNNQRHKNFISSLSKEGVFGTANMICVSDKLCNACYKKNEYEIASLILSLKENIVQEKINESANFNLRKIPFFVALIMLIILLANSIVVSNISISSAFGISLATYFLYYIIELLYPDSFTGMPEILRGNLFPEKKTKRQDLETKLENLYKKLGLSDRKQKEVESLFNLLSIDEIMEIIKNYKT